MNSLILFILIAAGATLLLRQRNLVRVKHYDPLPVRMHRRWYVTSAPNRHRV